MNDDLPSKAGPPVPPGCDLCPAPALRTIECHDSLSGEPQGPVRLCREHADQFLEAPVEFGFFQCVNCQRFVSLRYHWERLNLDSAGRLVCLRCAAHLHFANPIHWIDARAVRQVVFVRRSTQPLLAEGILNLAKCRHVLAVRQLVPQGVQFLAAARFGATHGHQLEGRPLLEVISESGGREFCPIMEAADHLTVDIGLYVRTAGRPGESSIPSPIPP